MVRTSFLLQKKIWREIIKNRKQFAAIILIDALAVCLFSGLSANYRILENRVNEMYRGGNMADIWTSVSGYDRNDISHIELIKGVAGCESRYTCSGTLSGINGNLIVTDGEPLINKPFLLNGSLGFAVDKNTARKYNFSAGDTVVFSLPVKTFLAAVSSGGNPDELKKLTAVLALNVKGGKENMLSSDYLRLSFVITGIMTHPENIENGGMNTSYSLVTRKAFLNAIRNVIGNTYKEPASTEFWEYLRNNITFINQYVTKIKDDADVQAVKNAISDYFISKPKDNLVMNFDRATLPSNATVQSDIVQAKQLTFVFPVIFFMVAVLIVLTTMSQIILRERTQLGTMKALGLSNRQILSHYISLCVALSLLGAAIGAAAGPLIIPRVMDRKYNIIYALPPPVILFPKLEILACLVVLCSLSAVAGYAAAKNEIDLLPAVSMRPARIKIIKALKPGNKSSEKNNLPSKMALRNIRTNVVRSLMVVIGIAGCTALLVCGFGIEDTLNYGEAKDMSNAYSCDIMISYNPGTESAADEIRKIYGVSGVEEYAQLPAALHGKLTANGKVTILPDDCRNFKQSFDKNKIAISAKTAKAINVSAGDSVAFTVLGNTYHGVVNKVFDAFTTQGIFLYKSSFPDITSCCTNAWVNIKGGYDHNPIKSKISKLPTVNEVQTHTEFMSSVNKIVSSIKYMTLAVKVFAILLAIVVLYNLANLNFKERIRDIATLKVLGFNKYEIAKSLVLEIMLLSALGSAIGLFWGMPILVLMLSINENPLVDFLYHIDIVSYFYALLLTLGTSFIINIILAGFTDRVQMVESLKSAE